jgi:hypothetical protein
MKHAAQASYPSISGGYPKPGLFADVGPGVPVLDSHPLSVTTNEGFVACFDRTSPQISALRRNYADQNKKPKARCDADLPRIDQAAHYVADSDEHRNWLLFWPARRTAA